MTTSTTTPDEAAADRLLNTLTTIDSGLVVVVTGAGVSHASGIATFRGTDPDAIWNRDVTEMGTYSLFRRDPVASWQWYLKRFDSVLDAEPNPAHHALAELERWHRARGGEFLLVTQNVDTLHESAGSESLIKVHGSADKVRCSRVGCKNGAPSGSLPRATLDMESFLQAPSAESLPRCDRCGSFLRQHVLWFDEYYDGHESYEWHKVLSAVDAMSVCLFVGTSFSVGVTDLFASASTNAPRFSVDPSQRETPYPGIVAIAEPAEQLLPRIVDRLRHAQC